VNELPINAGTQVLASELQGHVDARVMAGAVFLVADKSGTLNLGTVGWSDIEARRPMRTDTLFWVASITKPMTGAAFLMLVEEGRARIEDPVEKYIPGFAKLRVLRDDGSFTPPRHPVLIREILSHTSGMRFLNTLDRGVIDSVPLETSVEHALLEPLLFDPGSQFNYSNEGTDAVGRIIEIMAGIPYETFLQERLFTPLGMTDTTFRPGAEQLSRLAKTYRTHTGTTALEEARTPHLTYPLDGPARYAAPGGGLFSTVHDVGRFCEMFLHGGTLDGRRYLSRDTVRLMTSKQTGPLVSKPFGLAMESSGDGRSFGHTGALKTHMIVDRGQIRVFLTQYLGEWPQGNPNADFDAAARHLHSLS
jgi:CubicO group peptidase (beta-lactamase class C family)